MTKYTALHGITAPGTLVFGYRYGDTVEASVVENWGLVVGRDVIEGALPDDDTPTVSPARPGPESNRATWEAYAVASGMTEKQAAEASLDDLQAERDAKGKPVERPADSAKKADWVTYVVKLGADKAWANDDTTTRADLQAWHADTPAENVPATPTGPVVGDTVAVAATQAIQSGDAR
jgi:hypothetical protein